MADKTSGFALAAILGGAAFLYAGIRGVSVLKSVQAIIQGKSPATVTQTTPITGTSGPLVTSATTTATTVTGTAPTVTGNYTQADLVQLWQAAGGSAGSAKNAACHAMQESSGNAKVTSPNPDGGTNVGLWQLDTKGVGAGHTVAELQNPMTNATLTVQATGDGANWSAWATPGC